MKIKINYLVALTLLLSSCGTATYYSSGTYDDPAYYRPGTEVKIVHNPATTVTDQELQALKDKTREVIVVDENSGKTILPLSKADTVFVDINEYDSFEELLTKFNSPEYQIQVIVAEDDDNWEYPWAWGNPYHYWNYGYGMGGRFGHYGYYGYNSFWMDPWFSPYNYGYYNMYDSWMYWDFYYYGFGGARYGWYGNGNWPYNHGWHGYGHGNVADNNYYGRRGSDQRDLGEGVPSSGSYTRRSKADVQQIRGYNTSTPNSAGSAQRTESIYRRGNAINRSSNGAVYNTDVVTRTNSSLNRNNSNTSYSRVSNGVTTRSSKSSFRAPERQSNENSGSNLRSQSSGRSTYNSSNSSGTTNYQRNDSYNSSQSTRSSGSQQSTGSAPQSSGGGGRSSSSSGSTYRR